MEAELKTLLVTARRGEVELEGISISHSSWPATQHITPSIHPGFTATLETAEIVQFVYIPCRLRRASQQNNLAQRFDLTIQDLNEVIAPLLDLIPLDSEEAPQILIRSFIYSSTGVSTVKDGPYRLKASDAATTEEGFKTTAVPRNVNSTGTGRRMTNDRFPMLRGFSK